jgi:predicted ATPase
MGGHYVMGKTKNYKYRRNGVMENTNWQGSKVFVGREYELTQLHDQLSSVIKGGKLQVVLVQGDYGLVKSTLIERFLAVAVTRNPSLMIGKGKCAMETESNGLIPFSQILSSLAKEGQRWNVFSGNLWEFTKKVAPAWLDIVTAGVVSAAVTTIKESNKLIKSQQAVVSLDSVFIQFVNAIEDLTQENPAIFFLDDLQWADQSSLSLLFHLAKNLTDRAVIIIGTYRPVEAMEIGSNAPIFR